MREGFKVTVTGVGFRVKSLHSGGLSSGHCSVRHGVVTLNLKP